MRELGAPGDEHSTPAFPLRDRRHRAAARLGRGAGRDDFTPLWAGQSYRLARAMPAAELTRALAEGWRG